MSDQTPSERAYELWQDKIFVRHFNKLYSNESSKWKRYSRDELYDGIKRATKVRLHALQHVVRRLREHYRDLLILKKSWFSAARSTQARAPEAGRSLITFEKLNVACQEIENHNIRSLLVAEREAKFLSIRGLTQKSQSEADRIIDEIKFSNPQYQNDTLYVFNFASTSRDFRIKEDEFTVAISNEDQSIDLNEAWRNRLGLKFQDTEELLAEQGLGERRVINKSVGALLQVEVIRLKAMQGNPCVVIKLGHHGLFQFAVDQGLVTLDSPLVLDPLYSSFKREERIEKILRTIGGKAAPIKRNRRRRNTND